MASIDLQYSDARSFVHPLPGTPHIRGGKAAAGLIRAGLRKLVAVLDNSGWAGDHPIDRDDVSMDLLEFIDQLGPAEQHALRIIGAMLVRVARTNGYHTN